MEERLIKVLKMLKMIKPDEGFIDRSRQLILNNEPEPKVVPAFSGFRVPEGFKLMAALAMAAILLFVALGGLSFMNLGSSAPSLLTNQAGSGNSNFEIQLGQAKYDLGDEKSVGLNLEELIKNLSL